MRKHTVILIILLFMLLFSCTHAGAIDLAQGQYLKISEDTVTEVYVNIHSPSIIKCSPPYYTIQGETILHNKKHNTIVVYPTIYTYDYARQKIFFECNKISTYSNGDLSETFTNQRISGSLIPNTVASAIANLYFLICCQMPFYKTSSPS